MTDQPESAPADVEAPAIAPDASNENTEAKPETEVKNESESEDQAKAEPEQKEDLWPKKAINALSRKDKQLGKARAELFAERQKLSDLEEKLRGYTETSKKSEGAPQPGNFQTYEEYIEALTDYKLENRLSERDKKSSEQSKQTAEKVRLSEREDHVNENASKAKEAFQDFEAVMQQNASDLGDIAPHVRQAILDADNGAFALYALLKEGTLGDLNEMPNHKVVATITRMEDRAIAMSKNKAVSKAPAPMSSNKGTSPGSKSLESLSGDDLLKWVHSKS